MSVEKIVLDSLNAFKDELLSQVLQHQTKTANTEAEVVRHEINGSEAEDGPRFSNENYRGSDHYEANPTRHNRHDNIARSMPSNNAPIHVINAFNRNKRLNIMVIGAAVGLVFCLLILTSYKRDLPGEVVGIISTVSGIFGACLKDAYSFEFGSSRGSKDKDDKISTTILEKIKY